ncbi:MAG: hypothetical protein ABIT83_27215 [Massilia sp.]
MRPVPTGSPDFITQSRRRDAVAPAVDIAVASAVDIAIASAVATAIPSTVAIAIASAVETAIESAVETAAACAVETAVPPALGARTVIKLKMNKPQSVSQCWICVFRVKYFHCSKSKIAELQVPCGTINRCVGRPRPGTQGTAPIISPPCRRSATPAVLFNILGVSV